MRIILEGMSGVGKTYIGKMLEETLDIPFIEYLPDFQENELSIHRSLINTHNSLDNVILEGSLFMATLVKTWMYNYNFITFNELFQCVGLNSEYIHKNDIYILIKDSQKSIESRRESRGRPYEYSYLTKKESLSILDEMIKDKLLNNFSSYFSNNGSVIVLDRAKYYDEESLITDLVKKIEYHLTRVKVSIK